MIKIKIKKIYIIKSIPNRLMDIYKDLLKDGEKEVKRLKLLIKQLLIKN